MTRDFIGVLSANRGIDYEVAYLELDYVTRLTASEYLTEMLKGKRDSNVIASVPISVNRISGIEATVRDSSGGYSKMLGFVSGFEVYILIFSAKAKENLSSDEIDYFLRHFRMSPTPLLVPPDTRNIKSPLTRDGVVDQSRIYSAKEVTQKARILEKPDPQYTPLALKKEIEGIVVIRAVFAFDGQVTHVQVVKGLPYGLTEEAIAAAKGIRFIPALKDGHPVSMYFQLEYNFALK